MSAKQQTVDEAVRVVLESVETFSKLLDSIDHMLALVMLHIDRDEDER